MVEITIHGILVVSAQSTEQKESMSSCTITSLFFALCFVSVLGPRSSLFQSLISSIVSFEVCLVLTPQKLMLKNYA